MAAPVSCSMSTDPLLTKICDLCQSEWRRLSDTSAVTASAVLESDRLTISLHQALSPADLQLVRYAPGRVFVRRSAMRHADQFYGRLAELIETQLNCFVADSDVAVDSATGDIQLLITLRDVTRTVGTKSSLASTSSSTSRRTVAGAM